VWLAEQSSLGRHVAVKKVSDSVGAHALLLEARIAGMLEHPNIPPIHELDLDELGQPVLVMKRIEGASWRELLHDPGHPVRAQNPLFLTGDGDAHLEILTQVASALQYAHSRGVIHRDVKPANVMVGAFGEVALIDWGVAHHPDHALDSPGAIVGTPGYMAPEMARGEPPDARTDVYLLGATLHHVLTGRPRHDEANAAEAIAAALLSEPFEYGSEVPSPLAALCNRATHRDPSRRPQSALEFVQALHQYRRLRTATEIADRVAREISGLEEALREPGDAEAAEGEGFEERATACRFALDQSTGAWPDNPVLPALEARLRVVLLERALARGDLSRAQAEARALRALDALPTRLGDELAARMRRAREQRARERELDVAVGRRQREWLLGALVLVAIPVHTYRYLHPWSSIEPAQRQLQLVGVWAAVVVPVVVALLVARRGLAPSVEGRRLLGVVYAALGAMGVNRLLGLALQQGIPATIVADLVIAGCAAGAGAMWLGRPFVLPSVVFVVGAMVAAFLPEHAGVTASVTAVCATISFLGAQRSTTRARDPEEGAVSV
jgi:eukaryotic-like serine/threonine-protein kinase